MNKGHGGGGRGYDAESVSIPTDVEISTIITGDSEVSAQVTVSTAQRFGKELATIPQNKEKRLKASQIRNIFGAVRRIEMNWREDASEEERKAAYRELLLLQPKLGYQAARVVAVKPLETALVKAIQQVQGDRGRFQRFVDFFEAILAYHKAEGGAD